jgi:hypothetical protein
MEEFCCLDAGTQCRDGDVITHTVRLFHEVAECKADAPRTGAAEAFASNDPLSPLLGPFNLGWSCSRRGGLRSACKHHVPGNYEGVKQTFFVAS